MIHRIFEWREDQELGEYGWIQKGQPTFNSSTGRMIAHDVMEHTTPKYDHIAEEAMALGALIRVRHEAGAIGRSAYGFYTAPEESIGLKIERLLESVCYGDVRITNPKPLTALRGNNRDAEEFIGDSIAAGIKQFAEERADEQAECQFTLRSPDIQRIWVWMRHGYRNALRRYAGNEAWRLNAVFNSIAHEVDEDHKHGELYEELHVWLNPRTLKFRIERREVFE